MRVLLLAVAALVGMVGVSQAADVEQQTDALNWLKKTTAAAHQLNYKGTYIYQYGDHIETSKITHIKDESGEHEKLEALDGSPREVIRNNEEVLCFTPDSNTSVVVEKRKIEKSFPALLPRQLDGITENYRVRFAVSDRTAGHVCKVLILEPRDQYRYQHKLWIDQATGLLLKAGMLNERSEMIGQFAFTQVEIGGQIDKESLRPKIAGKKVLVSSEPANEVEMQQNELSWRVKQLPPGFTQVTVIKRTMPGKGVPVKHLVFSDGLATVSVFIEPVETVIKPMQRVVRQGAIHVYTRTVADHQITVLGEVPAITVMQIANSVSKN
ncbi:MAG: MucB/RseB C-terminal domain-containing protein [Gammaproteobacteria bacterium]|nr:MucB/RseB C-terminal domain-containing protein [Gammaproteobacteria bacterium]MBU1980032.1 MucB/RseB C-terminal domain-containing protein [Gammaproteobacteria bacterium]